MSDAGSGSEHSDALELADVYGKEEESEVDEEENLHQSTKYPGIEAQMSSVSVGNSALDVTSKLKYSSPIGAVALHVPSDKSSPLIITGSDDDKAVVWDLKSGMKLRSLKGEHSDRITSVVVFIPHNEPLAPKVLTASWDCSIIVWDLMTGDKLLTVKDTSVEAINAVAVCLPGGPESAPLIIGGCENGSVLVWDLKTGDLQRTLTDLHERAITAIAIHMFFVITASEDCSAVIWNVNNGKKIMTLDGHADTITSVAMFVPQESDTAFSQPLVVTGSEDQTAIVWGFHTGERMLVLDGGHEDTISAVSFCAARDGSFSPIVVTCSHDSTAVLWDLLTGRILRKLEGGHSDYINAVVVYVPEDSKHPPRIITAGEDSVVMIWELSKGDQIKSKKAFPIESRGFVTKMTSEDNTNAVAVHVPSDGNSPPLLVSVSDDNSVCVWNLATAQKVRTMEDDEGHEDWVRSVAVFTPPEGSSLQAMAISGADDGVAIVWDLATGKKLLSLVGEHSDITSIAVYASPEGDSYPHCVVTASSDKTAVVWDLQSGNVIETLDGEHTDYINSVVVFSPHRPTPKSPFNPLVLTGSDDETVVVWELKTGKKVRTIKVDTEGSEMNAVVVFEPFDHSAEPVVITGNEDCTVNLWDLATGELLRTLTGGHYDSVTTVAVYTPSDRNSAPFIVSGSEDYTVALWDLLCGKLLRTLRGAHQELIRSVAVYAPPDGSTAPYVISAGDDYHIAMWDLNARQMDRSIEGGHAGTVTAVAVYVPNNQDMPALAITGSEDNTLIIWELKSGKKVKVLSEGHSGTVTALGVYNPGADENATPLLVSTSTDCCTVIWNLQTLKKARVLKGHTGTVLALAIYTPAAILCTGGEDNTVIVWNIRSGKNLRTLKEHQQPVTALAVYAPSSDRFTPWVFSGSEDKTVIICELLTGKRVGALAKDGHTEKVTAIAVVTVGEDEGKPSVVTAGGGADRTIIVWSTLPFVPIGRIKSDADLYALSVYTPPDNPMNPEIVASGTDGGVSVWEFKSGQHIRSMEASESHAGSIMSLAMYAPTTGTSPAMVVTGGDDVVAMVWNYKSGNRLHALEGGHGQDISSLAVYAPADVTVPALLVTGSNDRACIVWDVKTGRKVRALDGADSEVKCVVVYTPSEHTQEALPNPMVIAAGDSEHIVVWDLHSGQLLEQFIGHTEQVYAMTQFHHRENDIVVPLLVSCGSDGKIIVWDMKTRKARLTLTTSHTEGITCVAVVNSEVEGQEVLIVTGSNDHTCEVWSFATGKSLRKLGVHTEPVYGLAVYTPDNKNNPPKVVSVGLDGLTLIWDVNKGEVVHTLKGQHKDYIVAVAVHLTDDGPLIVTGGSDAMVVVWDLNTGKHIRTMEGTNGVTALCTYEPVDSNTSALIFSATMGKIVEVWADCLIAQDYMPLPSMVNQVLEFEISKLTAADSECAWARIADMSGEFKDEFWLENYTLFTNVFERSLKSTVRDSFFKTFRTKLGAVIHLLPEVLHKEKGKKKSLLEVCIEDNLPIRGIVLDAWVAALNTPNVDFVNQMCHPCTYFHTPVLLKLGERFPAEFIDFVCRIKLIKSHVAAHQSCQAYCIDHKSGLVIEGLPSKAMVDMWTYVAGYYGKVSATDKVNQPVTAFVLPLVGAADLTMLNAYVDICSTTDNLAIFESDVGVTAFKYAWASFGLRIHMTTTIRYTFFIAVYTLSVFLFDRLQRSEHLSASFWAWFLQALVLLCVMYYIADESRQFWNENKGRVLAIKERLLDSRERAKEQKRKQQESTEEDKEPKVKPGQHRRHFKADSTRVSAAVPRRNPAAYTGIFFLLAHIELKLHELRVAAMLRLFAFASQLKQGWDDSIIHLVVAHFAGFWNLVDLAVMGIVTAGTIVRIVNGHETDSSRCILSVGSVVVWFKVLNFMRPFKHSGPLIAMILQIMKDIQYFVFILALVLTGFSMAFWLISYPDYSLEFGTIQMAFLNTYLYMLGQNISIDFSATASPQLGIVLLVMFMFFMMILMLNLLIALMGNSYSKVQEKGLAEWRMGQASMILEQSYMMSHDAKKAHERYNVVHVMKYTSLLPNDDKEVEVTDGQLSTLKSSLEARLAALERKMDAAAAAGAK